MEPYIPMDIQQVYKMKEPQTLQELRKFYEDIPEDKWLTGKMQNMWGTKYCAVGHITHVFGRRRDDIIANLGLVGIMTHNDNSLEGPKAGTLEFIDLLIAKGQLRP